MRILFLLLALSVPLTAQTSPSSKSSINNRQTGTGTTGSLHVWLLELSFANIFRRKESVRLAGNTRSLPQNLPGEAMRWGSWNSPICKSRNCHRTRRSSAAVGSRRCRGRPTLHV